MQSLVEEAKIVSVLSPASRSSAASGDFINMKLYDKLTLILDVGGVTAGGNVFVQEAKTAAGGSKAKFDFDVYQKRTASTDTYTKTSANTASSHDCITIGNSSDNKTFVVEIDAKKLSPGFSFVNILVPAAFSAALTCCIGIAHKARYAQAAPPTALT
jgi:hypothetical protein